MKRSLLLLALAAAGLGFAACTPAAPKTPPLATYEAARPILARRCLGCHSASGVAAEADLSTLPAVRSHASAIDARVRARSMPPTGAPLTDDERDVLLGFVAAERSR